MLKRIILLAFWGNLEQFGLFPDFWNRSTLNFEFGIFTPTELQEIDVQYIEIREIDIWDLIAYHLDSKTQFQTLKHNFFSPNTRINYWFYLQKYFSHTQKKVLFHAFAMTKIELYTRITRSNLVNKLQ